MSYAFAMMAGASLSASIMGDPRWVALSLVSMIAGCVVKFTLEDA